MSDLACLRVQISCAEQCILESKPESLPQDLRCAVCSGCLHLRPTLPAKALWCNLKGHNRAVAPAAAPAAAAASSSSTLSHSLLLLGPSEGRLLRRLDAPWPELTAYAESEQLEGMDDITHRHIPWGAPLIAAALLQSQMRPAPACLPAGARALF